MSYVFNVSLQPAGTLMPHPNVVVFVGQSTVSTETIATPDGPVTNPTFSITSTVVPSPSVPTFVVVAAALAARRRR